MKRGAKVTMEAQGESVKMDSQVDAKGTKDDAAGDELVRVQINPEVVRCTREEFVLPDGTRLVAGEAQAVKRSVARPHLRGADGHAPWLVLAE